jgi:DNA replication and repair protein RecF
MEVLQLRNIQQARVDLGPGLNVFFGANAQGKTTLLEGLGLLARGRSFRTEQVASAVRRGASALSVRGAVAEGEAEVTLEVELGTGFRELRVAGQTAPPRSYQGRLEVVVYSTDRLRVVRGPMRERRLYIDRGASALWPSYRQALRDYERVLLQRNAALEHGGRDLETWTERFVELGAALRQRRAAYTRRLQEALASGFRPRGESYSVAAAPLGDARNSEDERRLMRSEIEARARDERRFRRSLVGPHRDGIVLAIDGEDAAQAASSGQARSLLLALALASLEVYRQERGTTPVALLDDLDSELDEERAYDLCRTVAARGQALVTTAHESWASAVGTGAGRRFRVCQGQVTDVKES